MQKRTFASDNYSGVHPAIMNALIEANAGHAASYGADEITKEAVQLFRDHFGDSTEVFFVYNGTGANVLSLKTVTQSFNSILCSELAHINVDESTAPEHFTGCKLVGLPHIHGKITPEIIEDKIQRMGDQHHPQAKVISISQSTEYGTVYTVDEVKAIAGVARRYKMFLHMDGSRISNAAVALGVSFREFTVDAGVDVLSFGGTKNGMMFGEAVVFFRPEASLYFSYIRKHGMQLHSKMRFISAQFRVLVQNELWKQSAAHSNAMAKRLEKGLRKIPGVTITHPVDANGIFAILPREVISKLQQEYFFYVWNEKLSEVRLMCSFDTTVEDVDGFVETLDKLVRRT
jgi:threonine aldolase